METWQIFGLFFGFVGAIGAIVTVKWYISHQREKKRNKEELDSLKEELSKMNDGFMALFGLLFYITLTYKNDVKEHNTISNSSKENE